MDKYIPDVPDLPIESWKDHPAHPRMNVVPNLMAMGVVAPERAARILEFAFEMAEDAIAKRRLKPYAACMEIILKFADLGRRAISTPSAMSHVNINVTNIQNQLQNADAGALAKLLEKAESLIRPPMIEEVKDADGPSGSDD